MSGEDLERLRKMIDSDPDPEIKAAARKALFAILNKPVREESEAAEKSARGRMEYGVGMVLVIVAPIVAVPLAVAGVISVPTMTAAVAIPAVIKFGAKLIGKGGDK